MSETNNAPSNENQDSNWLDEPHLEMLRRYARKLLNRGPIHIEDSYGIVASSIRRQLERGTLSTDALMVEDFWKQFKKIHDVYIEKYRHAHTKKFNQERTVAGIELGSNGQDSFIFPDDGAESDFTFWINDLLNQLFLGNEELKKIVWRKLAGCSNTEIAAELNFTVDQVRYRVQLIKERITKWREEG